MLQSNYFVPLVFLAWEQVAALELPNAQSERNTHEPSQGNEPTCTQKGKMQNTKKVEAFTYATHILKVIHAGVGGSDL